MTPSNCPQDDLLTADALLRHHYRLEDTDPARANRAPTPAQEIVVVHGPTLREVRHQADSKTSATLSLDRSETRWGLAC